MGSISRHIMSLVINSLGADTHTHIHKHTYIQTSAQKQFQEPRRAPATGRRALGLKVAQKPAVLAS